MKSILLSFVEWRELLFSGSGQFLTKLLAPITLNARNIQFPKFWYVFLIGHLNLWWFYLEFVRRQFIIFLKNVRQSFKFWSENKYKWQFLFDIHTHFVVEHKFLYDSYLPLICAGHI